MCLCATKKAVNDAEAAPEEAVAQRRNYVKLAQQCLGRATTLVEASPCAGGGGGGAGGCGGGGGGCGGGGGGCRGVGRGGDVPSTIKTDTTTLKQPRGDLDISSLLPDVPSDSAAAASTNGSKKKNLSGEFDESSKFEGGKKVLIPNGANDACYYCLY